MNPLQLTAAQVTALQAFIAANGPLAQALAAGVVDPSGVQLLGGAPAPVPQWSKLSPAQQVQALAGNGILLAAILSQLGLPVAVGVSTTVGLAALTSTQGSLTFTAGILTAFQAPA